MRGRWRKLRRRAVVHQAAVAAPPVTPPTTPGRYYADTSYYNKVIPASPVLHGSSGAMVTKVTGWGLPGNLLPGDASSASVTYQDFGNPIYQASASDPLFTIQQNSLGYTGTNWGSQIRIPQNAVPADGSDHHLTIISPDGTTEWSLYDVTSTATSYFSGGSPISPSNPLPSGGGTIYAGGIGRYATNGTGLPDPYTGGGDKWTAGGNGGLSGDLTITHLDEGRIPHALRMAVKSTGTTYDADAVVPPAIGAAGMNDPVNAPPDGARFQLNMTTAEIDALSVIAPSKVLLKCLAEFGMYVFDTTGAPWKIYLRSTGAEYVQTGTDPWRPWAAGHGMTYSAAEDVYVWSDWRNAKLSDGVTSIWTRLRVLDWTNAANR